MCIRDRLTPEGAGCPDPFAHLTVWTGTWMLIGAAVTSGLSWVYAATTWAVAVTTGGTEIIEEVTAATKQLVFQASSVGDRTINASGQFLVRIINQSGGAVAMLIVITTAIVAKTLVYEFWYKREARARGCVLPWWRTPEEATATAAVAAAPDTAQDARTGDGEPIPRDGYRGRIRGMPRVIPYVPNGKGLPAHVQSRVERYEKRASKLELSLIHI